MTHTGRVTPPSVPLAELPDDVTTAAMDELRRDPPLVLVCRRERIVAVDSRIKNATLGTWGILETLPDWEVSP